VEGRREKWVFFPVGTSGRWVGTRKGGMGRIWWIYCVSILENRRMKSVEIVLRRGRDREKEGE
jgi:hypothetical protein